VVANLLPPLSACDLRPVVQGKIQNSNGGDFTMATKKKAAKKKKH
jgi:hypothetical protein